MITKPALKLYANLKKDTLLLVKRKKYLYLFIALPLIIATIFLFTLNSTQYNIKVGICDFDQTDISTKALNNLDGFSMEILTSTNCLEEMQTKIKQGDLNLGIEIGQGFSQNIQNLDQSKLIIYYDSTDIAFSNLISWKIDQSLQPFEQKIINTLNQEISSKVETIRTGIDIAREFSDISKKLSNKIEEADQSLQDIEEMETEFLTNPIWTDKRSIYTEDLKSKSGLVYIFPILALFITLMLSSTSIIYDKNNSYLTRIKTTSSLLLYIISKLIFFTALTAIQFAIILTLFLLYGSTYTISPIPILQLILFIGITNTALGLLIGLIANNEGIAVLFSLIISFPLMLMSGIFFPTVALPKIAQWTESILPLHHQIIASKTALLFAEPISCTLIYPAIILTAITYYLIKKSTQ
jgi:ABC-2 type transport system permease protein